MSAARARVVRGHADLLERGGRAQALRQIPETAADAVGPENVDHRIELARGGGIEAGGVGEDHGVGVGMGQIEAAAQRMAELVMQRHAGGAERHTGEKRAVRGAAAGVDVARFLEPPPGALR